MLDQTLGLSCSLGGLAWVADVSGDLVSGAGACAGVAVSGGGPVLCGAASVSVDHGAGMAASGAISGVDTCTTVGSLFGSAACGAGAAFVKAADLGIALSLCSTASQVTFPAVGLTLGACVGGLHDAGLMVSAGSEAVIAVGLAMPCGCVAVPGLEVCMGAIQMGVGGQTGAGGLDVACGAGFGAMDACGAAGDTNETSLREGLGVGQRWADAAAGPAQGGAAADAHSADGIGTRAAGTTDAFG